MGTVSQYQWQVVATTQVRRWKVPEWNSLLKKKSMYFDNGIDRSRQMCGSLPWTSWKIVIVMALRLVPPSTLLVSAVVLFTGWNGMLFVNCTPHNIQTYTPWVEPSEFYPGYTWQFISSSPLQISYTLCLFHNLSPLFASLMDGSRIRHCDSLVRTMAGKIAIFY